MLRIFISPIADASGATAGLSEYRLEKLARLKRPEARAECLTAGLLLAHALRECFGVDAGAMNFTENENGKPHISERPDIHFNITHTGGLCAVALSDAEVGIDAERSVSLSKRRLDNLVKSGYFSESEITAFGLRGHPTDELTRSFYRLWTAKESVVKCSGEGIAVGFKKLDIPFFTDSCQLGDMHLTSLETAEHIITVCSPSAQAPTVYRLANI